MTVYRGKLLELKSIKQISNKIFLQARLSFKGHFDIYLEIDAFTSENISTAIEGDKRYKYRISFNSSLDTTSKHHIGTLTKTYLNHSEKTYFLCSEKYIDMLNSIRQIEDVSDLDKLSFVSRDFESVDIKQAKLELPKDIKTKVNIHKSPKLILFSFSAIFIMFFSYFNLIPSNETEINKGALAQSIELHNVTNEKEEDVLDLSGDILASDHMLLEDVSLDQSDINFIELDQTITYSIPKGNVALTFDDGPSKYSKEIVDILKEYGVGGTFFFIGKNITKHPDNVKYVQSNGFSIGSHSINHHELPTLSYIGQEIELFQSMKLLEEIANVEITLFRPPYGSFNRHLKDLIHENEYKMVLWNNDPEDWKTRNSDKIFDDIQNSNASGSIILLHESQAVIDALPRIIEHLQQLNLDVVNLR